MKLINVVVLGIGESFTTKVKNDAHVVVRLRMRSEDGSVFDVVKNRFDNVSSMSGEELISTLASYSI